MFNGYFTLAHWRGVPIRFHWSVPLGAFALGRFQIVPGFWAGYLLLVMLHEIGHASIVRARGLRVTGIDVSAFGGLCHWNGKASRLDRALIAWGGVWAQLLVLAVAYLTVALAGHPRTAFLAQLFDAFTIGNMWLIGINLLPIPPLDGVNAWSLFPQLAAAVRARHNARNQVFSAEKSSISHGDAPWNRDLETLHALEREHPEVSPQADALIDKVVDESHLVIHRTRERRN